MAGRISKPQMQKSRACCEQRWLRFAEEKSLSQLRAGRVNLDLLRHGGSRSRARCSEPTADSNGDNDDKFAAGLARLKLLYQKMVSKVACIYTGLGYRRETQPLDGGLEVGRRGKNAFSRVGEVD